MDDGKFDSVCGGFVGEMSPTFGPRTIQAILCSTNIPHEKQEWLLNYVLRDASLEYDEDLDVKMTTRLIILEEAGVCVVCVNFRDLAEEEFSVPLFNATICVDIRWAQRMKTIFQPLQDRLKQLVRIATTQLVDEEMTSTVFVNGWFGDFKYLCQDVDNWVSSTLKRCVELPWQHDCVPILSLQAWVTAVSAHHRCIIRGDDPQTVKKWVHTLTHFMLDDRLMFASDVCSTSVDGIVPDLHLQGTTAEVTPEFIDKLYLFQYPCCVVDISKPPQHPAHVVPKVVYPSHNTIQRYRAERNKWFCGEFKARTPMSPFLKVSPKVCFACDKFEALLRRGHDALVSGFLLSWRRKLKLDSLSHYYFEKGLGPLFPFDTDNVDADVHCVTVEAAQVDSARVAPKQQMYETRMDLF